MENEEQQPLIITKDAVINPHFKLYVYSYTLLATLNSIVVGYEVGVMSGAILFIKEDLNLQRWQEEALVGSLNLVSAVGCLMAGRVADKIGRRGTMALAAVSSLMGTLLMTLATSFSVLLAGRVITAIGVGASLTLAPLYISEVSPPKIRGTLVSLPEILINSGILLAYLASYLLSSPWPFNWRLMLGLGSIPAILLLLGITILPESPRWLVLQNRPQEAEAVLRKICRDSEEVEFTLAEMILTANGTKIVDRSLSFEAIKLANDVSYLPKIDQLSIKSADTVFVQSSGHKEETADGYKANESSHSEVVADLKVASDRATEAQPASEHLIFQNTDKNIKSRLHDGSGVWLQLLCPTAAVRKMLIIGLGLQFFQQASGNEALVYYTPTVLNQSGVTSKPALLGATVLVGLSKTLLILVPTKYLDIVGRRPLLLTSSVGMTISLAIVGASLAFIGTNTSSSSPSSISPSPGNSPTQLQGGSILALLCICVYMGFFSVGFGPICSVVASEIYPSELRAQAMSLGTLANRIMSGTVAFSFLSIANLISIPVTFFLFSGICLVSVLFVFKCIPETKGRTLEELSSYLDL